MRGATRVALATLATIVFLVGCASEDSPMTGGPTTVHESTRLGPTGVATAFDVHPQRSDGEDQTRPTPPPRGRLKLVGCRWRAPYRATFDFSWTPAAGVEHPVTFTLALTRWRGDTGDGSAGDVTLRGPGRFSVTDDEQVQLAANRAAADPSEEGPPSWEAARYDLEQELTSECSASTVSDGSLQHVEPTVDPVQSPDAPKGTVEALAAGVDTTDLDDRLLPLALLLAAPDLPSMDALLLSRLGWLDHIEVVQDSTCTQVRTTWSLDGPDSEGRRVEVAQRHGCPARRAVEQIDPPAVAVELAEAGWDLRLVGTQMDVEEIREALYRVPFGHGDDAPPVAFDPDAYIDGVLAHDPQLEEVARFDWAGGRLAVVRRPGIPIEAYGDPIIAVPGAIPEDAGSSGTACRTHAVVSRSGPETGFLIVVLERAGLAATVRRAAGSTETIDTVAAAGGRRAGLVELDGGERLPLDAVRVTDAEGADVGCDQSF